MRVIITGRRYNVSKGLKKVIEEKLSKIKFFYDQILSFHVIIEKEKLSYKAEITFSANGKKFYLQEIAPGVHEAIDTLVDKLERQVRKHKDKIQNHKRSRKELREQAESVPSEKISFITVDDKPKTELEVMLQLAISETDYIPFFEENGDGVKEAAVAVKIEEDLFDIYVHDSQIDNWLEKKVYLEKDEIVKTEMQDFTLLSCSVADAIAKLSVAEIPVVVFENKDDHTVQAIAAIEGGGYELVVLES